MKVGLFINIRAAKINNILNFILTIEIRVIGK